MTLDLRILLCSFAVSMPLVLLHFRSDSAYRLSRLCVGVLIALILIGVYQAIAVVRVACMELETDHWLQYVVMFVLFSLYAGVLMIPEFRFAPVKNDDW